MDWFCPVSILVVIAAAVISVRQGLQLEKAKDAYYASLAQLKSTPTDADLRARTLALGREYSALTRQQKSATVYDEVAIANDIGAACASAAHPIAISPALAPPAAPAAPAAQASGPSLEDRLAKLESLRQRGLITEVEYQARREKILDEL